MPAVIGIGYMTKGFLVLPTLFFEVKRKLFLFTDVSGIGTNVFEGKRFHRIIGNIGKESLREIKTAINEI